MVYDVNSKVSQTAAPESSAGQVRTVRLAQSCNGEYSNFFGATSAAQVSLVLAAFNATLTRVNGVNEKDLAIHFNLIANTTAVIYYDPATDPYTTLSSWNGQLQATLTSVIGEANYDIGHMFGASGGGGNAGCIGCVCVDGQKGSGITSPADAIPMGDNFDIDYVVHEMGHQLGANHSFSFSNEGTGVQKEIGSGITIMGYAGITAQDVAPHSIDTFHEANIAQIQTNLAGKTCPVTVTMTANHPPVVAPVSNYTIPISTPFTLTGSATDPENDALTYQWEQNDNSTTTGAGSIASPTKLTGPNWLSFLPTSSPSRTFPRLSTIQAGLFVTPVLPGGDPGTNIEALSSVARTLNFRLTVRDNNPYVAGSKTGQTQFTDMAVTVSSAAGPFKVTSPNTNVNVLGGGNLNVTWDVAGTTGAPISVANVKISLSTDGGNTFPTVLAASTANDGSELVAIPSLPNTTTCRIKVEAIGNIFFDMSDANFTITGALLAKIADFDGDGKTDLSVFRSGSWLVNRSSGGNTSFAFGLSTDRIVPGDYDGDAKTDYAVFRNGTWYLQRSTAGFSGLVFGTSTDIPVPGDYDGDAKTDVAVYRPSSGTWYVLRSSDNAVTAQNWGISTDVPVPGDYDGDGKADYAVFRSGTWYLLRSTAGATGISFGLGTDAPVPSDYDGDGKTDIATTRNVGGFLQWYIQRSTAGYTTVTWGLPSDRQSPGDYDGDGKSDVAVFRAGDGSWTIQRSSNGSLDLRTYGASGDVSVPGGYIP
ncbi:MAG TPA: zinc-dependent metalloprotease family protein [Pyrinomonadaceae bacterium]